MGMRDGGVRRLPLADCRPRTVYRVASRNLLVAVCTGRPDGGFIGVREKFGGRYLFAEHHWETGPPFGTLSPLEAIGTVPDDVELREYEPSRCSACGRPTAFDRPVDAGGRGWEHTDGTPICPAGHSYVTVNRPLLELLERYEAALDAAS